MTDCLKCAGYVSMTCVDTTQDFENNPLNLVPILGPVLAFGVLLLIGLVVALLYWRKLIADVANYKQTWTKRRSAIHESNAL